MYRLVPRASMAFAVTLAALVVGSPMAFPARPWPGGAAVVLAQDLLRPPPAGALALPSASTRTPVVAAFGPGAVRAGGSSFTLSVRGRNFVRGAVVLWNGSPRPTTYFSSRLLRTAIRAEDIAAPGTSGVAVANPSPNGLRISAARPFAICERSDRGVCKTPSRVRIIERIPVGPGPHGVAVAPNGRFAFVTSFESASVDVVDLAAARTIAAIAVDRGPVNVVLSADGSYAYVTNEVSGTLSVISTQERRVVGSIALGVRPHGLALSPDGRRLYVCNLGSDIVSLVDVTQPAAPVRLGEVAVGDQPDSPAVSPDGRWVWVTNFDGGGASTVSVIDLAATPPQQVATVPVGSRPHGIQMSPDGKRVYVSLQGESRVVAVDTVSRAVVASLTVGNGPHALGQSRDGRLLLTGDLRSNTAMLVEPATGKWRGQLFLGTGAAPHGAAFAPNGRRAYLSNFSKGELIVMSTGA